MYDSFKQLFVLQSKIKFIYPHAFYFYIHDFSLSSAAADMDTDLCDCMPSDGGGWS